MHSTLWTAIAGLSNTASLTRPIRHYSLRTPSHRHRFVTVAAVAVVAIITVVEINVVVVVVVVVAGTAEGGPVLEDDGIVE